MSIWAEVDIIKTQEEFPNMLIFKKAPEQKLLELCSEDLTKNILCLSLGEAVYLTETKRALFSTAELWEFLIKETE